MTPSAVFSSLIEPLQQGQKPQLYVCMLADETEEEVLRTLSSCLTEILQEENSVQNVQLVLKWMREQFSYDNIVSHTSTRVFEQLCHVGRFDHVIPLTKACLGVLDSQEQKAFFMEQTLQWLSHTVYHPLLPKSNIFSFLNQSLEELAQTLNTTRDHLFYLVQTFIASQELFEVDPKDCDGQERVLAVMEMGRGDKQAELNMLWVVVDRILDEHQHTGSYGMDNLPLNLKKYTDKIFSFDISFDDILNYKNKQWKKTIYQNFLGEEGLFRQEDAFFCVAFVLNYKREDSPWMNEVYHHSDAQALLETVENHIAKNPTQRHDTPVRKLSSFFQKSILVQETTTPQKTHEACTTKRVKKL